MIGIIDKNYKAVMSLVLLAINIGCVFLFHMIDLSVLGSKFERTMLSICLQYLSVGVLVLFIAVLMINFKNFKNAWDVIIVSTILNIFLVIGGVVCSIPFLLRLG